MSPLTRIRIRYVIMEVRVAQSILYNFFVNRTVHTMFYFKIKRKLGKENNYWFYTYIPCAERHQLKFFFILTLCYQIYGN